MTKTKYNPETTNWNDSYLLGIPMIDNQHKKFFVILDNLVTLNQKQEKSEMHSLINELQNYATIFVFIFALLFILELFKITHIIDLIKNGL